MGENNDLVETIVSKMGERFRNHAKNPISHDSYNVEAALYHVLSANLEHLPPLEDDYNFVKSFRTFDVTDSGHIDMVIWHLLNQSKLFWEIKKQLLGVE